jgi:hypothetical protein
LAKKHIDVLRRTPAYSFGEAAHYLGLPVSTLRAWCLGQAYLQRVERDTAGIPIKLYPFTSNSSTAESPAPVEIDPRISFGRPVLKGRGVPTAVSPIASRPAT